ncbi:MAG TPA: UDP-N-acetylmuramate dehydrogenase [Candidatus Polarisedimenticolaceae bacterium]|nr:UDP-N-acetylmuramate dehydrogenase [Candidatus Polarisedimenticolaceae bacterium]
MTLAERLRAAGFRGGLEADCPLAPHTTWRIGGPAELLAQPLDRADLSCAARWAAAEGVPWRVLGNGSNLLVADAGVRGVVLRVRRVLDSLRREDERRVLAGAGASFPALARFAAAGGLAGLEFAAGIPGTVGGAIVMNAGWHEFELGHHVERVELLEPTGEAVWLAGADCGFGYRTSRFRQQRSIVLGALLHLEPGEPGEIERRFEHYAAVRKAQQPTELPSCGSVFLKPTGDFAGRLIEQAGLKGLRVGDIQVSSKHANFFVNLGRGTARDALTLVERVEAEVERRFGVRLAREFELW